MVTDEDYDILAKEHRELVENYQSVKLLAAQVVGCGRDDIDCILEMEKNHDGTIDRAVDYAAEGGGRISFWHFVQAVKWVSLDEVIDYLDNDTVQSLDGMTPDDNYSAWSPLAAYGRYVGPMTEMDNVRVQDEFARYVLGQLDRDEFVESFRDIAKDYPALAGVLEDAA